MFHPKRNLPLSLRERARVQGFPDYFKFYGTKYDETGLWNHTANVAMINQTGKAMPLQFCNFVADQIKMFLEDTASRKFSGKRLIRPNEHVTKAKYWYCNNIGYGESQKFACMNCWISDKDCHNKKS